MGNTDRGTVTVDPTKYFPDDFVFGARSFYDAGFIDPHRHDTPPWRRCRSLSSQGKPRWKES